MKRQIYFILFFAFCAITAAHAQSTYQSSILFRHHNTLMNSSTGDLALNLNCPRYVHYENNVYQTNVGGGEGAGYSKKRTYHDIKQIRRGGIALTVVGSVLMLGGIAMIADGAPKIQNDFNNSEGNFLAHFYETYFGAGTLLAGSGLTIGGIVTWVKAERRIKKYLKSHPEDAH